MTRKTNRGATTEAAQIQAVLDTAVNEARALTGGRPAAYIPELANADLDATSAAVKLCNGTQLVAGDHQTHRFTLQSSAKVVLLAGLLEERGAAEVFRKVGPEPSGSSFASIARLETHGPIPANPLVNAGAIALCDMLHGSIEQRVAWIKDWAEKLYGARVELNQKVLVSERANSDRNRSIAHLLSHNNVIHGTVDDVLEVYIALCSLETGVTEASQLPAVLANGGIVPGSNQRVLTTETALAVTSVMATCGMYDESGAHLLHTGLPAKSGVSGVIIAVAPRFAGIAVASPRINNKGGSVRGHAILETLSNTLNWHFAAAGGTR